MNVTLHRAAFSLAVLLGSASMLLAQQPAQPRTAQPRPQAVQPIPGQPGQFGRTAQPSAQMQQLEPSIVTLLIIDNNKEIALGQLGQQKSQNDDVKQFCEMIAKDHSDFVQKLQERSGGAGRTPGIGFGTGADRDRGAAIQPLPPQNRAAGQASPGTTAQRTEATQPVGEATAQDRNPGDQGPQSRTAANQKRNRTDQAHETHSATASQESGTRQHITVAKPVIGNQPGAAILQLHQEIAEACLERARRDADKQTKNFDIEFMGAQIVAHNAMLDKLHVFQQHVSPELKQVLADGAEATQKHLEDAKRIHEKLSQQGTHESENRADATRSKNRQ